MWFFISIILFYSILLLYFTYIWNKQEKICEKGAFLRVSIIIPFNNEEKKLASLIESFEQLNYPAHLADFIFVNDHSTDNSIARLDQLLIQFPFPYQILTLPDELIGKKQAIVEAVAHSNAPVILSTDADCSVPSDWIKLMQAPFNSSAIHLVSGNVVFRSRRFLDKVFQMEFAPLIGVGGVSIKLGKPGMANGANLAFRKSTFLELDVFKDNMHIPTGDDVFLVQKVSKAYPQGIIFQKESRVFTDPPANLTAFYHQRLRWASKWKAAAESKNKLPAIAVWMFHFLYLIGITGFVSEANYSVAIVLFLIKLLAELNFLWNILNSQQQKFNIFAFIILQMFYSIYVIIFGLMSNFSAYEWKGRIYGKHER
jgi:cellulose synthase/poly-beta-1,6-N-acetylglucosamine synthase-like glycosyltransferase